jgi:hypothetical protein
MLPLELYVQLLTVARRKFGCQKFGCQEDVKKLVLLILLGFSFSG